jgi:hypothetical protein
MSGSPRWASRSGELADKMNSLPKYVVSSTLQEPRWSNSTVLAGDVVKEVSKLKQELAGDIVVYASGQLVRTLMKHDLVDELRLMVYPVVLGAGGACSAGPATRSPCGSSAPGPWVTASPTSPSSSSETPDNWQAGDGSPRLLLPFRAALSTSTNYCGGSVPPGSTWTLSRVRFRSGSALSMLPLTRAASSSGSKSWVHTKRH